jgi:predicted metal-binding membrane protein
MDKVLNRDRLVVLGALAAVVALAWAYLAYVVLAQPTMDMDAIAMAAMPPPVWDVRYFAATLAMWMVMMVGMMLPSAAPTVLLFDALQMHGDPGLRHRRATALFAAGYVLAWAAFGVLATSAQWALSESMLLSAMMTGRSPVFIGSLLVIAGTYQFTRWKTACLSQCRSPAGFLVRHRRRGPFGPLLMGVGHGVQCIGCCWALMALLFAFGVMNLVWVAALAVFVFVEKLTPAGALVGRIGGFLMIGAGLTMMAIGV